MNQVPYIHMHNEVVKFDWVPFPAYLYSLFQEVYIISHYILEFLSCKENKQKTLNEYRIRPNKTPFLIKPPLV